MKEKIKALIDLIRPAIAALIEKTLIPKAQSSLYKLQEKYFTKIVANIHKLCDKFFDAEDPDKKAAHKLGLMLAIPIFESIAKIANETVTAIQETIGE